ncbi:lysine--tRNA ligase [Candidatus Hydrogenosomobacter endosymbioticus]|uniref:Lysine--tRNA ligase n=1 Tax=Candidatus Hydrogenosomobacter endosymbioticus TaxID=2558174 RepID=A0ABN6L346_9PROT|nr:lysine--tRNA ligase [Candidatus Hydrogenosomobacter endosymbioticus]BDB96343.1 lysine--tRNA ligase [Candidatus Hydrogenosomobacter endosymbioticus]
MSVVSISREIMEKAGAWPFEEARKLVDRLNGENRTVLFETGYGPSGLPHMGTFGEVVRTSMVRFAFEQMTGLKTDLICFSDDMDGLRKVPGNVPNQDMLAKFLNYPLTKIPDPFGKFESFGHHNNAMLRSFLDSFGFEYRFMSSTDCYFSGMWDGVLLKVLESHEEILDIMLPTLGEERQKTYSPFLPISPKTGKVLQVFIEEYRVEAGTIVFKDEDGELTEVPVTGGRCKMQWKADWASRWVALGVDYEMSGKDLIPTVKASSQICKVLGGRPPEGFSFELFLDKEGKKVSKSKGNVGLSVEDWMKYAPHESLSCFMYHAPRRAKRLYFDVIPRYVDEYISGLERFDQQRDTEKLGNPVWHIHKGNPPKADCPVSFMMLLNLASVCGAKDKSTLWRFISRYCKDASPKTMPFFDRLTEFAVRYYNDFIQPSKQYRAPSQTEREAILNLRGYLETLLSALESSENLEQIIQQEVYEMGKRYGFQDLREWFSCLYEVLLGQREGPRMGSFIAFYGVSETIELIDKALEQPGSKGR